MTGSGAARARLRPRAARPVRRSFPRMRLKRSENETDERKATGMIHWKLRRGRR